MTISSKHIDIKNLLNVKVLSNRNTAISLFNEINNIGNSKIILDFSEIEFASRSFLDELNSLIHDENNKEFIKENMNDQVHKMDLLVQNTDKEDSQNQKRRGLVQI